MSRTVRLLVSVELDDDDDSTPESVRRMVEGDLDGMPVDLIDVMEE